MAGLQRTIKALVSKTGVSRPSECCLTQTNGESFGEDPYFVGRMSIGYIKGLQGDNPKYLLSASTVKHFLANVAPPLRRKHRPRCKP